VLHVRRDEAAAGLLLLDPAEAVVLARLALGQLDRIDLDGRHFQRAALLALAAAGAMLGMHRRDEQGMLAGARVELLLQRDGLVDDRTDAVADVAAQAEEVEAVLLVDQHRQTHLRLVDVGQLVVERARRAGLDAGNVLAHLAGQLARDEIRRAGGHRLVRRGQAEDVVGAVAHAQPAADAGAEEVLLRQRAGRAHGERRQRLRLLGVEADADAEQPDAAGHARGVEQELPPRGCGGGCLPRFLGFHDEFRSRWRAGSYGPTTLAARPGAP